MIHSDILSTVGHTPLVRLTPRGPLAPGAQILAKQESRNPLGSVKDRLALALVADAEAKGLSQGGLMVEPTSGNTGIGLAMVCALKKIKLILTMPESMSLERRQLLKQLGAEVVLTPAAQGMAGAKARAEQIAAEQGAYLPDQFANPANPAMHRRTTGPEIWADSQGQADILVAGVGTGGTISGTAEYLKSLKPSFKAVAVEPAESPVLSGGKPGPHAIQGIGAGFVPLALNRDILDEVLPVKSSDALAGARSLARQQGMLCGISSGAAYEAACLLAGRPENENKTIVVILPDTGERYLSTDLFK